MINFTKFLPANKKNSPGGNPPKKKKVDKGCPFYAYQQLQTFRNHVLVREDLISIGKCIVTPETQGELKFIKLPIISEI